MPGYGSGGGGRFFVWSGTSRPFSTNRGPTGHARAIHKIELRAGWARGFVVNVNTIE
jgi:hypothetical protein